MPRAISDAAKQRLALVQEGPYALAGVVSPYDSSKGSLLDRQAVVYGGIHTSMNRAERAGQREWWFAGEEIGESKALIEKPCAGHDAIDESQHYGFSCIKGAAGQDQFEGSLTPHISW